VKQPIKLYAFATRKSLAGTEFSGPSWSTWRIIMRLVDGDAHLLSAADQAFALKLTGRSRLPTVAPREVYIGAGRRGGKSRFGSLVAVWLAAREYPQLAPGEVATVVNVAPDRDQAAIDLRYAAGLVDGSDVLRAELVNRNTEALDFKHRTRLEVATASYRTVRGRTLAGCVLDESAFLRSDDSAVPDLELVRALRPAMMTLKGLLLVISSPHRKMGLLWQAYQKYYGNDAATNLYIQATSRELNPLLDQQEVADALAADPEGARSEHLAEFRADNSGYLSEELIEACLVPQTPGRRRACVAFVDMSGGRVDAAALGIAHAEDMPEFRRPPRLVLDALIHVDAPHEPQAVVEKFAQVLKDYKITKVVGDRYGAEWVTGAYAKVGITYEPADLSASEIYAEMLAAFSERRVQLIDDAKLLTELRLLERKPRAGGRGDSIDHPKHGGHDDLAIACVGALWRASGARGHDSAMWERLGMDTGLFGAYIEGAPVPAPYTAPTADEILASAEDKLAAAQARLDELNRQLTGLRTGIWSPPPIVERAPGQMLEHDHQPDRDSICEHCRDLAFRHERRYVPT
jgi:hypothetical protein